ncbi:hypothetical protein LUZ62_090490 [Rhynchospora pubera]|uniref:Uncharacterized protein n=1 Tax=Rhynchospora pubera TaxID=906938 RepID=A0AAV8CKT0_9POAL|nr:hypothetical protein LUZ62_090490 [Rhynchospora pubera]
MAVLFKLLTVSIVIACFICSGQAQCSLSNVIIKQSNTGVWIHGKPEIQATINSACPCQQYNVTFDVAGFQTTEEVDPNILNSNGLVYNGNALPKADEEGLKFKYAWDSLFLFKPISSQIACS